MNKVLATSSGVIGASAIILLNVLKEKSENASYNFISKFLSEYNELVIMGLRDSITSYVLENKISYEDAVKDVLLQMNNYIDDISQVPALLNTDRADIISALRSRMDTSANVAISGYVKKWQYFIDTVFEFKIFELFNKLDSDIKEHYDNIHDEELLSDIKSHYETLSSSKKALVLKNIPIVMKGKLDSRTTRITGFYNIIADGMMLGYGRVITSGKQIVSEYLIGNQGKNFIEDDIEDRMVNVLSRNFKFNIMSLSDDEKETLKTFHFVTAVEIRDGSYDEIIFRTSRNHMPMIIRNRSFDILSNRSNNIQSDVVLSDAQKKNLEVFNRESFDLLSSQLKTTLVTDTYTENALLINSDDYLKEMLGKMESYVGAIFSESDSILRRAKGEGIITCASQFFQLRRAMGLRLFFSIAQEQDYDVEKTTTRFWEIYDTEIANARAKMISFVRIIRISALFDDSQRFLSSLGSLFFYASEKIHAQVVKTTEELYDQLADIVGASIDEGIESVFEEESVESREVIEKVFNVFIENLTSSKARMMIFEVNNIVDEEVNAKFNYIVNDVLPPLVTEFRSTVMGKFDFAWMEETQKQFVTGSNVTDIDFDGMRKYTIEEMNKEATESIQTYVELVNELSDVQIMSIGDSIPPVVSSIKSEIESIDVNDLEKEALVNLLDSTAVSTHGLLNSIKSSLIVSLNSFFQEEIRSMDQTMDELTQSFFATTQQVIVNEFYQWAGGVVNEIWEEYITKLVDAQKDLANKSKVLFRQQVDTIVSIEDEWRGPIEASSLETIKNHTETILEEYDIVSYGNNANSIKNEIELLVKKSTSSSTDQRKSAISAIEQEYLITRVQFQQEYIAKGRELKTNFNRAYSSVISAAYSRYSDILNLSSISDAMATLSGPLKENTVDAFQSNVEALILNPLNDLPEVNMVTICYPHGMIPIVGQEEGDLESIMAPYLMLQLEIANGNVQEFEDGEAVGEGDEENDPEHYERIVLAMSEFDGWFDGIIEKQIEDMEANIDQSLRENTCGNKPTCELEGGNCEDTQLSCRENYTLGRNMHGVMCCTFNPPANVQNNAVLMAEMIGVEMAIMFFTTPGAYTFMAKSAKKLAGLVGVDLTKFARMDKLASKLAKAGRSVGRGAARVGTRIAQKAGYKAGSKIGTRLSGKLGVVLAKVAAKKVLVKGALSTLTKSLASGPFAIAMFIFDVLSLILDIWDPNGFNDVEALENIVLLRDTTQSQYTEALKAEGINAPMVSSVMYKMDPTKQGEFISELFNDWFMDHLNAFMTANEDRWALMANSAVSEEYAAKIEELSELTENDNFISQLIFDNTEDTMLVRASSTVGTDPSIIGTSSDPDYDVHLKQHRLVCSLTEVGVESSNNFNRIKNDFENVLITSHMYRWVKLERDYKVYEKITESQKTAAQEEIDRRAFLEEEGGISDAELALPIISRVGWLLERVDPESEFWLQHRYRQEMGSDKYEDPSNFHKVWDWKLVQDRLNYDTIVVSRAEEILKSTFAAQEGVEDVSLEMIKNPTEDSPSWYPEYDALYEMAKGEIDQNIEDLNEENRLEAIEAEELLVRQNEQADKFAAEKAGISLEQARTDRLASTRRQLYAELDPSFAVFKDGYGQISPLYQIYSKCQGMEHGVTFNSDTGLCQFTQPYCHRYGLDYKFNTEHKAYDCNLSGHQRVAESIFGTSITRTFRGGGTREGHLRTLRFIFPLAFFLVDAVTPKPLLGSSTTPVSKKIGLSPKKNKTSSVDIYRGLEKVGLGSTYSLE